ncbi:MAG: hypothetical protein LBT50_11365, partial [Prevotellaceae bacterium]|nr:hypothetical protein [Prevotellaceae bacterium]
MRYLQLITCSILFLLLSCKHEKTDNYLISDFHFNIPLVDSPEELLGNNVKKIFLENTMEALVGNVNKIIKKDDCFYILS